MVSLMIIAEKGLPRMFAEEPMQRTMPCMEVSGLSCYLNENLLIMIFQHLFGLS